MYWRYILFLFLYCTTFTAIAQKKSEFPGTVIPLKTSLKLKERCLNYKKTMYIADSLLTGYLLEPFFVEMENSSSYQSGASFLYNLYSTAKNFKPNSDAATTKVAMMEDIMQKEMEESESKEYNKILTKAEEYYANGDLDKAIELYERATVFKPSDKNAADRLEELRKLKGE